jgi:hypothetical protein
VVYKGQDLRILVPGRQRQTVQGFQTLRISPLRVGQGRSKGCPHASRKIQHLHRDHPASLRVVAHPHLIRGFFRHRGLGSGSERALVQSDGNIFPFQNNYLCHVNLENFTPRQPSFDHAQSDGRDLTGGKRDTNDMVHHPIPMEKPLPSRGCVGVPSGFSSKCCPFATQSTQDSSGMVGRHVSRCNHTDCCRMFCPGPLLFGSLTPLFLGV